LDVARYSALTLPILNFIIPFVLVFIVDGMKGIKEILPVILTVSGTYTGLQLLLTIFHGQELVVDKKQPANHADANKAQALPETGEENPFIGTTVFGGLSLALGAALLAGRRREL
ncbi:L-lactate permease, partial [Staphylococcus aureus]|uniref:L-lactate permease n=1 Tax=Staphylococcus aureus TaxID=1280 RepID=UPI001F5B27F7